MPAAGHILYIKLTNNSTKKTLSPFHLAIQSCLCGFLCFCRAQSYAERLRLGLAVIHGEAQCSESDMADGRHSPPSVRNTTGHTGLELPCKISHLCLVLFILILCIGINVDTKTLTFISTAVHCPFSFNRCTDQTFLG